MSELFNILNWILAASFGVMFLYLAMLSILALVAGRPTKRRSSTLRNFAIVVPAHNEERTIARTLDSLRRIDYPRALMQIIVVADNCTDKTKAIAARTGAVVLERNDSLRRGKGYALAWVFDQLLWGARQFDAFVVIDADSIVSENFLRVMNEYLEDGYPVLQAADVPEARPGVWSSEVIRIGMTLYNIARPLGRRLLGFTAGLRGNGMCFSADIIRSVPWRAYSLTEDLEYALQLLGKGIITILAPEATVYTILPSQLSESQRERWEAGRFAVVRKYSRELLQLFLKTGSLRFLDAFVDLLIPPFVNAFALAASLTGVAGMCVATGLLPDSAVLWAWVITLLLGGVHVIAGLIAARADKHLFQALAYVPRYAAWKLSLYGGLLLHGIRKEWIRTARE